MGAKIEKSVFERLIKKFVNEHGASRSSHSSHQNHNAMHGTEEELPVFPNDHMSVQLSHEMPNVADDKYIPSTVSALSDAASTIAQEVPEAQVEFFYNQLHSLLQRVMDREEEARLPIMEALLFEAIDKMLNEDEWDDLQDKIDATKKDDKENVQDQGDNFDLTPEEESAPETPDETARWDSESSQVSEKSPIDVIVDMIAKSHLRQPAIHKDASTKNLDVSNVIDSGKSFASFGTTEKMVNIPRDLAHDVVLNALKSDPAIRRYFAKATSGTKNTDAIRNIWALRIADKIAVQMPERVSPDEVNKYKANASFDTIMRLGTKAAIAFIKDAVEDVKSQKLSKEEQNQKLSAIFSEEIETPTGAADMPKDAVDAYSSKLEAALKVLSTNKGNPTESSPIQPYKNALRQISGQNPDKTGIYNADQLAPFFGLKGANAMRQGLATNAALKYQIQQLHDQYQKMESYSEDNDYFGQFIESMNDAFNDFAMSDHIKLWIANMRKSPHQAFNNPTEFVDKLEEIYTNVESGSKTIYDYDKDSGFEAQLDLLKYAFENATNKKMMATYRKDLQSMATDVVLDNFDDIDYKTASVIGDRLMGNKQVFEFKPADNPTPEKPYSSKKENDLLKLGIDKDKFMDLRVQTFSLIGTYLKQNMDTIFDKIFNDSESKSKVLKALDNAVNFSVSGNVGEYKQLTQQLAIIGIINDHEDGTGIFDLNDSMEDNIEKSKELNRADDEGNISQQAQDSDFGINEQMSLQIKQITNAFKSGKISPVKYEKARQIISRLG